jgi:hypothetical protein
MTFCAQCEPQQLRRGSGKSGGDLQTSDYARTNEQSPEAVEYLAILASWLTRQALATP